MAAATASSLLRLIDGVISQSEEQIAAILRAEQLNEFTAAQVLAQDNVLCRVVLALPQAHIASEHDGSLPLHFAASLGKVSVAKIVYRQVRRVFLSAI